MNRCYLALGSNQKNPERQLRLAIKAIDNFPNTSIKNVSSLLWTKAWGIHTQQDFCNAVVEIVTQLNPALLLSWCRETENNQGRVRKKTWGPRTLDIDILLYAKRTINSKGLTIPHPHMLEREFVMQPFLEINPTRELL